MTAEPGRRTPRARQPYAAPRLVAYGDVAALTRTLPPLDNLLGGDVDIDVGVELGFKS